MLTFGPGCCCSVESSTCGAYAIPRVNLSYRCTPATPTASNPALSLTLEYLAGSGAWRSTTCIPPPPNQVQNGQRRLLTCTIFGPAVGASYTANPDCTGATTGAANLATPSQITSYTASPFRVIFRVPVAGGYDEHEVSA